MTTESELRQLHELAHRYAHACDTHDGAEFADIFTEDGVIISPRSTMTSREQISSVIPPALKSMYLRTMHMVFNNLVWINGDTATGETYCQAHHITKQPDGTVSDYIMSIIYDNQYRKVEGRWYFSHRKLNLKWSKTDTVDLPPE
jgi:uncharacterized protein (TIGR02246 family)